MKKQDLTLAKALEIKELKTKAKELNAEIADLVLDKNMKKLKDVRRISKRRKDRAQILTILRQKEILGQLESRVESQESSEVKSKKEKVEKMKGEKS